MNNVFTQGHALIVGIGGNLPGTVDDAKGIADLLNDPSRCAYPPNQVFLLTEAQATRAAILAHMDALATATNSQSTVVLYFSGHGCKVASSVDEHYYLIPADYDPNHFDQTTIDGNDFTRKLAALPAKKLVVLLDCCHAGGITELKSGEKKLTTTPLPLEARTLLAEGRGRVVIASSQEHEFSFAGRPYSAFTLALMEAFCGIGTAKQDGYVRVADLALHSRQVVPTRTQDQQHPILHFDQADNFVVAYYAAGSTQSKGLPFTESAEVEPHPGAWALSVEHNQTSSGSRDPSIASFPGKVDYVRALDRLRGILTASAPDLVSDLLVYENRLQENVVREQRYGSTETTRAERTEIVDRLNELTRRAKLNTSFNELVMGDSF